MKNQEVDLLAWLQHWYASQCDGMWEHEKRIHISTIDNPGWRIKIGLRDTYLMNKSIANKEIEKSDDDWIHYWVEDNTFQAAGGSQNLIDILKIFKRWAEEGII